MDSQLVIDWAENTKIFLLGRQAEMNEQTINDPVLIALRNVLNTQGKALYDTLNGLQRYIDSR